MASQHPKQIDDIMDEVYGNAGTIFAFKVDPKHANDNGGAVIPNGWVDQIRWASITTRSNLAKAPHAQ